MNKKTLKNISKNRMGKEELQAYLKSKTQSGKHRSPKDYNRKDKSWRNAL